MNRDIHRKIVTDPGMQREGLIVEHLRYTSSWDETSPLFAYVVYPENGGDLPVIVNTPGYSESSGPYRVNLNNYLAAEGWLMVWVDMRGRGGSAGMHDSGGLEIHDIYDAVCAVADGFSEIADVSRIGFRGESGGGGNAISCMVKLPDTFCVGASFFGIQDYTKWQEILLERGKAESEGPARRLGATAAEAPDRYLARNSTIAAANNPHSAIFLFNDEEEHACPPLVDRSFVESADAAELSNVVLSVSDSTSPLRTRHFSSAAELFQTRKRYLDPLMKVLYPVPRVERKGEFVVIGFVITREFAIYCGDGQDAVARVEYSLDEESLRFASTALSSTSAKPMTFRLTKLRYREVASVRLNGRSVPVAENDEFFVFHTPALENRIIIEVRSR